MGTETSQLQELGRRCRLRPQRPCRRPLRVGTGAGLCRQPRRGPAHPSEGASGLHATCHERLSGPVRQGHRGSLRLHRRTAHQRLVESALQGRPVEDPRQLGLGAILLSAQDTGRSARCLHLCRQRRGQGAVPQAGRLERQPCGQGVGQRLPGVPELRTRRHERVTARRLPAVWRQEVPDGCQEVLAQGHDQQYADAQQDIPRRQAR